MSVCLYMQLPLSPFLSCGWRRVGMVGRPTCFGILNNTYKERKGQFEQGRGKKHNPWETNKNTTKQTKRPKENRKKTLARHSWNLQIHACLFLLSLLWLFVLRCLSLFRVLSRFFGCLYVYNTLFLHLICYNSVPLFFVHTCV